ncbi:MAG: DUF92 domain-containing protein [Acidobacteria bacterium]|nr:DUF92 domain-containing protein [Acidobacteriota bacterium]
MITRGELLRKVVHMSVGLIAFSVRFLGPAGSAACALGATLFNLLLLPRLGGKSLWREEETARGASLGIVLYPLTVLLLILACWRRLEVAAAVWGILAFGDGMASLVGMSIGRQKLPWNPGKSWAGTIAYWVFGTAGCATLLLWTAQGSGREYGLSFALAISAAAALLAAALESLPQGLDDNLGVPLVTGLFLFCLTLTVGNYGALASDELLGRVAVGAGVNLVLAVLGYATRGVNLSGFIAGFLVGTLIYTCLDWRGYLLLLTFFVLGTAATKLGYQRKAAAGLAQEGGGRRGAKHALANTWVAAASAFFALTTAHPELFTLTFAAAFATKTSDTAASEIGQLWGRRTFLLTTLRPVPRGTEGAVSLEGTVAGILGSLVVAVLGAAVGLFSFSWIWVVVLAAFVGTTLESLVGATLEKRGLLDNEAVNFLNTLIGALTAAAAYAFLA